MPLHDVTVRVLFFLVTSAIMIVTIIDFSSDKFLQLCDKILTPPSENSSNYDRIYRFRRVRKIAKNDY